MAEKDTGQWPRYSIMSLARNNRCLYVPITYVILACHFGLGFFTGVPQRSIVGPLLFHLYNNNMEIFCNLLECLSYINGTT